MKLSFVVVSQIDDETTPLLIFKNFYQSKNVNL